MSFLKRAVLYSFRQKTKSLILFLMLTVIFTLLLNSFAIRDASENAVSEMRTGIGGKLKLEIDTEGNFGNEQENDYGMTYVYIGDYVTQPIIDAVSKIKGVVDYNVEDPASVYYAGVSFQFIPTSWNISTTKYGANVSFTSCLSSERCSAFESGKYTLVDGRHIKPDDSYALLISKELADYNGIKVGDMVKVYSSYLDLECEGMNPIVEMEIVGIFNGTEGTATGTEIIADQLQANCGYVAYNTLFNMFAADYKNGAEYQSVTVYVDDPAEIQKVYDEISSLPEIQGKTLKLSIVNEEYQAVETPLDTLGKSVNAAIIVITLASFAVVTLFLSFCIKGRKNEIGILLSIGKSKLSIVAQFMTETAMILIAAFLISIIMSNFTVAGVCKIFIPQAANDSSISSVEVPAEYLLPTLFFGFLFAALAVTVSSLTVYRSKPKDILAKYE